jgi:hypothetical protein
LEEKSAEGKSLGECSTKKVLEKVVAVSWEAVFSIIKTWLLIKTLLSSLPETFLLR